MLPSDSCPSSAASLESGSAASLESDSAGLLESGSAGLLERFLEVVRRFADLRGAAGEALRFLEPAAAFVTFDLPRP